MKSIMFMYHASNIGGGTYCLLNILKEIDREKYNPIVLLRSYGDLVEEIKKLGISVYYMPSMTLVPYNKSLWTRGTVRAYLNIKLSINDFKNIISSLNIDAVYLNTMMLAPYLKAAKEMGVKTFIHLREHWPLSEHVSQLKRVQSYITKYADEILAINSYSASMVPSRSATIIYDWIDMSSRYEYMPYEKIIDGYNNTMKVYLFTGGIQAIKGTCDILNLFRNNIQGGDKRLLILGVDGKPSKNGFKNKLKYYLSKVGIDSYEYKFWRLVQRDARVVCMPSNYSVKHIMEQCYCNLSHFNIPHANLALAESIIVGAVPVAAATPESFEYSNNGELAVLYEINNNNDLLEKLQYLDENYDEIKNKIRSNSRVIEKMFDKNRNVYKLAEVYDRLLKY
ncbi:MAG: glycosyltransferase [Rikenellaceae bacterium]|nr:glycosyltransferase [Rikenellaceae bacterium]